MFRRNCVFDLVCWTSLLLCQHKYCFVFLHSSVHSLRCLLSTCYVPGAVVDIGKSVMKQLSVALVLWCFCCRRHRQSKQKTSNNKSPKEQSAVSSQVLTLAVRISLRGQSFPTWHSNPCYSNPTGPLESHPDLALTVSYMFPNCLNRGNVICLE